MTRAKYFADRPSLSHYVQNHFFFLWDTLGPKKKVRRNFYEASYWVNKKGLSYGLGQYFQDLAHSFSPYGPPSLLITYMYVLIKLMVNGMNRLFIILMYLRRWNREKKVHAKVDWSICGHYIEPLIRNTASKSAELLALKVARDDQYDK